MLVVEGHGEMAAALNLVTRLWRDLGLPPQPWDDPPIRGLGLHTRQGVERAAELVRRKPDVGGLLMMRDEDDACPRDTGPSTAEWLAALNLPFPAAVVLLHREYETLFLPCLHRMAGRALVDPRGIERQGLRADAHFDGNPEGPRDAKGEVSARFAVGSYKPTLDQLALTRMIDFDDLRASGLPSFGTLERVLRFLGGRPPPGAVYPAVTRGAA